VVPFKVFPPLIALECEQWNNVQAISRFEYIFQLRAAICAYRFALTLFCIIARR